MNASNYQIMTKWLKKTIYVSSSYLLLFPLMIFMVLYLDTVTIAQNIVPLIPWELSYANIVNFSAIILAWIFSLHQSLAAADPQHGLTRVIIIQETIMTIILGVLVFTLSVLHWEAYTFNAYITILCMTFLAGQAAVSRMFIMTKSHAKKIFGSTRKPF